MFIAFTCFSFIPLCVLISHKLANSKLYFFISLPRKIGLIISTDLGSFLINSFFFSSLTINASFNPVRIPRLILIFQAFKGVPTSSILDLIPRSIGLNITQLSLFTKLVCIAFCLIKTLKFCHLKSSDLS